MQFQFCSLMKFIVTFLANKGEKTTCRAHEKKFLSRRQANFWKKYQEHIKKFCCFSCNILVNTDNLNE